MQRALKDFFISNQTPTKNVWSVDKFFVHTQAYGRKLLRAQNKNRIRAKVKNEFCEARAHAIKMLEFSWDSNWVQVQFQYIVFVLWLYLFVTAELSTLTDYKCVYYLQYNLRTPKKLFCFEHTIHLIFKK